MSITTRAQQTKAAAAARAVGGWDNLVKLSDDYIAGLKADMSDDRWRKLYQQEFPPPEVIRMTHAEFDNFRKTVRSYHGYRVRESHCGRYWMINDAIVEFITRKEPDCNDTERHRGAPGRARSLFSHGKAKRLGRR